MLDEPFNGMDPEGIVWMRGFLAALAAEGRAVLVSSHLMSELQETASHLVIIGRGKVIADTSVADLLVSASGDRVTVRSRARWDAMTALANARAEVAPTGPEVLAVSGIPLNGPWLSASYAPSNGYFPLSPWAGFAVTCGWAAFALALATCCLRRRDA